MAPDGKCVLEFAPGDADEFPLDYQRCESTTHLHCHALQRSRPRDPVSKQNVVTGQTHLDKRKNGCHLRPETTRLESSKSGTRRSFIF